MRILRIYRNWPCSIDFDGTNFWLFEIHNWWLFCSGVPLCCLDLGIISCIKWAIKFNLASHWWICWRAFLSCQNRWLSYLTYLCLAIFPQNICFWFFVIIKITLLIWDNIWLEIKLRIVMLPFNFSYFVYFILKCLCRNFINNQI